MCLYVYLLWKVTFFEPTPKTIFYHKAHKEWMYDKLHSPILSMKNKCNGLIFRNCIPLGIQRSVENAAISPLCILLGMHPYRMLFLMDIIFSTERYIPNGMPMVRIICFSTEQCIPNGMSMIRDICFSIVLYIPNRVSMVRLWVNINLLRVA